MLVIAAIAGLAAVVLAARWMQKQGGDTGRIAVANVEIELGSRIAPEMVRMVDWPQAIVPTGSFATPAVLEGRVVKGTVQRGEPITENRLAPVGSKGGLSAVVPAGKRAMTVRVNDVVGVAGFALPGTYVDVMVNTQGEGARNSEHDQSISKIVLERIFVLAIAQESDRDTTKPKVVNAVTLEVTPEQAELLDLARSVGTLSLVLRNQIEDQPADTMGATKAQLLATKSAVAPAAASAVAAVVPVVHRVHAKPAAAPVAPAGSCVEVIRGLNRVNECF